MFKAKAYLDLRQRKESGETVDSNDIKKHKKDILRIVTELMLENTANLPATVKSEIDTFIKLLEQEPFDENSLKIKRLLQYLEEYLNKNNGEVIGCLLLKKDAGFHGREG